MGFFSGIKDSLMGTPSESQSTQRSGFALLPKELQEAFKGFAGDLTSQFGGGASDDLFTPLPQTGYETQALESAGRGITPTAESLQSDIAMQMNPFDTHVIDEINRQAGGDYSILKQAASEAGQLGSNRQILGANDIDISRLNQIGGFKQDQYNRAVDNSLNQLTTSRGKDIGLQMGAGDFLRGLDTQTKQAPINALSSYGGLLSALPQSGGSKGQSTATGESKGLIELASGFF